jgi:solute carrier family 35 (UDP-sugar transporter), member A1/2/3
MQSVSNSKKASSTDTSQQKNAIFGLICIVLACSLSGLAGVYFEKILKNSKVSIWVRNIQLGTFGSFFALLTAAISDFEAIRTNGFFHGYTFSVWINIIIQSAGGLIVAVVIKYADNILKGFATSIAIIVSCLASAYIFGTIIDGIFVLGTTLVVISVVLYSYQPVVPKLPTNIGDLMLNKNNESELLGSPMASFSSASSNSIESSFSTIATSSPK